MIIKLPGPPHPVNQSIKTLLNVMHGHCPPCFIYHSHSWTLNFALSY